MTGGDEVHGGVKFYRGNAAAARNYVEADRSRVDDYYLAEGTGLATHIIAINNGDGVTIKDAGQLDGPAYERWVAGYDVATGLSKGRLRQDDNALRFVEVVVNGPKSWSLAAAMHPAVATAYDAAQDRAAGEIIAWLADHATTRIGPRGRQVQIPVERLEAAIVRHHTSRAGDPHRHLHLQINARVFAAGTWRGLHSVGVVDSINALNGMGRAAMQCDPQFRKALADHGYTLDPRTGEVTQFADYVGRFSVRTQQITRNVDSYEAEWRAANPGREPGPKLRAAWDRRAWAQARPDKLAPLDGAVLTRRWHQELADLGYAPPNAPTPLTSVPIAELNRDAVVEVAISRLGAKRSSWNAADVRREVERLIADVNIIASGQVRRELAEDLTSRALSVCVRLLERDDVPEHVRALTSKRVVDVEDAITAKLMERGDWIVVQAGFGTTDFPELDPTQVDVARALAGTGGLLVVEGAAGSGKTTTLAAAREMLVSRGSRMVIVTPTLQAATVAADQVGTDAHSAGWLIHQHGYRWDDDGFWWRVTSEPEPGAQLRPGDLLLIDEAGMLDQDTALALLKIAQANHARVAFVGDRHQLPAVGRGGVLDLAATCAGPRGRWSLETVHRFSDSEYADMSLLMRSGDRAGHVFDTLMERGEVVIHSSMAEALQYLARTDGLVVADRRDLVSQLNSTIQDTRHSASTGGLQRVGTRDGRIFGIGDPISTRRNDRELDVANRDTWVITGFDADFTVHVTGRRGHRALPPRYVDEHVELAYATTAYGAQGQTVDTAHLLLTETTGAASAYVAMTRGRHRNTAHLVAKDVATARQQWVQAFSRDRADLGPNRAATVAEREVERYGGVRRPRPEDHHYMKPEAQGYGMGR